MADERIVFACPKCRRAITAPLLPLPAGISICRDDGRPAIPRGYFAPSDDDYWTGSAGRLLVHLEDLVGTRPHPDLGRHNGCCGRDGCDGPNLVCDLGHEIATERSDCWMAHAVVLVPGVLREGSSGNPNRVDSKA